MQRSDGRELHEHRSVEAVLGFQRNAEGSVLYRAGKTVVLCTASIDASVPAWMVGKGRGWITAEYQMHPRAAPEKRESRDGRGKAPSGRTQEIQRLIGRALRAAVDLDKVGEKSIVVDCDVLEADGGTRTASITGGFIALAMALDKLAKRGDLAQPVLREQVAAISVGLIELEKKEPARVAVDLVYVEDSRARVDLNLVATDRERIVEVQGTAEGEAISRTELDRMIDAGLESIRSLVKMQRELLERAEVDLSRLMMPAAQGG